VLRKALWAAGFRYQKNVAHLAGKPDLAFPGARVAVFCDGDFWHGRDWHRREVKISAGNNGAYWVAKIQRNMQRDLLNTARLERAGWCVVRLWEGDILRDTSACVDQIRGALSAAR
jgi:DNA mismatch endonuclease (patch repair protein)